VRLTLENTEQEHYGYSGHHRIITIYEESDDHTVDDMLENMLIPALLAYGYQQESINRAIAGIAESNGLDEENREDAKDD
jgi:Holliday junction resolvasome RuvABC DNA-binding subunit